MFCLDFTETKTKIVIIGAAVLLLVIILVIVLVHRCLRKAIKARCAELENRLEAELQEKNDISVRCADVEKELAAKLQENSFISVRCADVEKDLAAKLQENSFISVRCAELENRLQAELQEKDDLSARCADVEKVLAAKLQENSFISVRCADLEKDLAAKLQENSFISVRCADVEKRLEAELQEKNDLSVRLSAIIASRIKDGNTTIVDLSDENRPTKLAEYFSELYDNEWTDCFDELKSQAIEESERIRILLKILTDIFNACLEWSTEDYFLLVQRAIDRTYISQADTQTDERQSINETAESGKESEHQCIAEVPSTAGNGPYNKHNESGVEANVHIQGLETTEAWQYGKGEKQSSTEDGSFVKHDSQTSKESGHNEEPFHDSTKKGSSLGGQYISSQFNEFRGDKGAPLASENEKSDSTEDQEMSRQETKKSDKLPAIEKEAFELPKDLLQPIKEIKKRRALKVLPTIHEFVQRKIPTLAHVRFASAHFKTYIQKCTEFSWLAVVQDPPLVLLADEGTKFDRKLFKEYMRRGPFVEFVVWPALLVEDGGAILSKGVAQGTDKSQKKINIC